MSAGLDGVRLALLAHELRGALTVVLGLTDLLRRDLDAPSRTAALDGVERAVSRADALLQSALEGEAPTRAGKAVPVALAALAADVVADQRAITGRDVILDVRATPIVAGDPDALARALGNLIDNALKYSFADAPVEVSVCVEGSSAVIEVADRGSGIPEVQAEAVFEPFERLGRDGTVPGSGLGLAAVRSVAESHGGSASASLREGGGTVMRLLFPVAEG